MPLRLTPSVCTTCLQMSSWKAPTAVGPRLKTEGTRRFPSTERCGIGDVAFRPRPFLLASSPGSSRGSTRHGIPPLPGKTPPPFPRPPNLCLQSPHPATDTLQGVAARRSRRGAGGEDAEPLAPGLRKMVPSGDTGEAAGHRTNPFASRPERRAGRACAAHKGAGDGGCVGIVRRDGYRPEGAPSVRFAMERGADAKTERPMPETGEQHPGLLPLQRDPSRGQKPLNGALKGATYKPFSRGSFQRPVRCSLTSHGRSRRVDRGIAGGKPSTARGKPRAHADGRAAR